MSIHQGHPIPERRSASCILVYMFFLVSDFLQSQAMAIADWTEFRCAILQDGSRVSKKEKNMDPIKKRLSNLPVSGPLGKGSVQTTHDD